MIYDRAENWFIDLFFIIYFNSNREPIYNVMKVYVHMVEQLTIYGVLAF